MDLTSGQVNSRLDSGSSTTNSFNLRFGQSLDDGEWHFVVVVFDASSSSYSTAMLTYVDGLALSQTFVHGTYAQNEDYDRDTPLHIARAHNDSATEFFAGTLDEGGRQHGIAGLTAANAAGVVVEDVGTHFEKDERVWRVKWYAGLALFSELGLACGSGITD